jgi:hypothetical protein
VANDTMLFNAAVTSNADLSVAIGAVPFGSGSDGWRGDDQRHGRARQHR